MRSDDGLANGYLDVIELPLRRGQTCPEGELSLTDVKHML